jgi:hypothetical protein
LIAFEAVRGGRVDKDRDSWEGLTLPVGVASSRKLTGCCGLTAVVRLPGSTTSQAKFRFRHKRSKKAWDFVIILRKVDGNASASASASVPIQCQS